jgi:hypothetical protein
MNDRLWQLKKVVIYKNQVIHFVSLSYRMQFNDHSLILLDDEINLRQTRFDRVGTFTDNIIMKKRL